MRYKINFHGNYLLSPLKFTYYQYYHLRISCEWDTHRSNYFKNSINISKYMLLLLIFLVFYWPIVTGKCTLITDWNYNALIECFIARLHDVPSTQTFAWMNFQELSLVWVILMAKGKDEYTSMFLFFHDHAKYHLQKRIC